ncbi:hypothetical protein ACFLYA_01570 [Candidatus Dependentiae bacterium]
MENQKQNLKQNIFLKKDENILVVKRDCLFPLQAWQGIEKPKNDQFLETIMARKEFLPRSLMEHDVSYKQIIPYLVFKHADKYFLMQRKAKASEQRLKSKYSLGIGGHIRQEDIKNADIAHWARREFHEEVDYNGNFEVKFLGILNDDSNDVGKVHVGFVYLLEGNSPDISVKSELQSGQLVTIAACARFYDRMEGWSKIVFDYIYAS